MKNKKIHLQFVLLFIVVFAVVIFFTQGTRYIGKSFYQSNAFEQEADEFVEQLARVVIRPLTEEDFNEILEVTEEEITRYRLYYGTLAQQIQNIKDQYAYDLEVTEDEDVLAAIKQERDAKIADIQKNFDDDDYVKEKIIATKEKIIEKIIAEQNEALRELKSDYNYYAYEFKDTKTGETFSKGNVKAGAVLEKTIEINQLPNVVHRVNLYEYEKIGMLNKTHTIEKDVSDIEGVVTIPKSVLPKSGIGTELRVFTIAKYMFYGILLLGFVALLLFLKLFKTTNESFAGNETLRQLVLRIPIDVQLVGVLFIVYLMFNIIEELTYSLRSVAYYVDDTYAINIFVNLFLVAFGYVFFVATIYLIVWTWQRIKDYENVVAFGHDTLLAKFVTVCIEMFKNRSLGVQALLLLMIIFLGGLGLGIVLAEGSFGLFLLYALLFIVVFIPALFIFMKQVGYLNVLLKHTEDMAQGRLTDKLVVKGNSALAQHAANLNGLSDGVRTSLNEQAKSERLKTELITNVSHDLRTPLTSIITYTDLLKNPDITVEERQKYIAILDAKSHRLKTLIEDLFEVSKMASGNMEITKQRIDLVQLLQQAIGEHEEDFVKAGIDLRVSIGEQPIYAQVDGQKWWRVIDNLVVNARKYSLAGTRVYIHLKMDGQMAEFTIKNVAKYELNGDANELVERFKRADTSRHTEGSGLGLAIAQSIVDLHGGQLDIAIDGDLFKVTVQLRADM